MHTVYDSNNSMCVYLLLLQLAQAIWMGRWNPRHDKEPTKKDEVVYKDFLIAKYEHKQWYQSPPEVKTEREKDNVSAQPVEPKLLPPPSIKVDFVTTLPRTHVYVFILVLSVHKNIHFKPLHMLKSFLSCEIVALYKRRGHIYAYICIVIDNSFIVLCQNSLSLFSPQTENLIIAYTTYVIALSQQVQNMYGMFIKYVTSRLGCLRLPVEANSPLNSMGVYTVFDRTPLPCIGDLPNGLHIDLKFQNQAIQCCVFF